MLSNARVELPKAEIYNLLTNAKTDAERRRLRSKTFDGIAQAMASQWGTFVKHEMEKNND